MMPNRLAATIALPFSTPPDLRVRVRRFQMPEVSMLIPPALGQRRPEQRLEQEMATTTVAAQGR
jgi:hypothetical protein